MTLVVMFFGLCALFLISEIWQLVILPRKQDCNMMPGGIARLHIANIVFITMTVGPFFGFFLIDALALGWVTTGAVPIAAIGGCVAYAIISNFGVLSGLLSDAWNAGLLPENSKDGTTPSEQN
jgi:hypothetical protein